MKKQTNNSYKAQHITVYAQNQQSNYKVMQEKSFQILIDAYHNHFDEQYSIQSKTHHTKQDNISNKPIYQLIKCLGSKKFP